MYRDQLQQFYFIFLPFSYSISEDLFSLNLNFVFLVIIAFTKTQRKKTIKPHNSMNEQKQYQLIGAGFKFVCL